MATVHDDTLVQAMEIAARRKHVLIKDEHGHPMTTVLWWQAGRLHMLLANVGKQIFTSNGQSDGILRRTVEEAPADWVPDEDTPGSPGPASAGTDDMEWPVKKIIAALTTKGTKVTGPKIKDTPQGASGTWEAKCPSHNGQSSDSLVIFERSNGTAWVYCHSCSRAGSGKAAKEIMEALGLKFEDLWRKGSQLLGEHPNAEAKRPKPPPPPRSLQDVERVWDKWMAGTDRYPLYFSLAVYAANRQKGDPVWGMVVGGSATGKTESIGALNGCPNVVMVSTITGPAALLSATPKKEISQGATGGLLRQVGEHGVLILKDFTSIISMHREERAEVLSALREVYDGSWTRVVGAEGGRSLTWAGKCGMLAGCTSIIDQAHGVISAMGDRWLMARMPEVDRREQSRRAILQGGKEAEMRNEIAETVAGFLLPLDDLASPDLSGREINGIVILADLASKMRSPVLRDYRGEVELVLDPEAATRIGKALSRLYLGLQIIGLDPDDAWEIIARVALDSTPKLRRAVVDYLARSGAATTSAVGIGVRHPQSTTTRALDDLRAHGVIWKRSGGAGKADNWGLEEWAESAYEVTQAPTSPEMSDEGSQGEDVHSEPQNSDSDKTEEVGADPAAKARSRCCGVGLNAVGKCIKCGQAAAA